jgi:hypothetical protein
MIIPHDAITAEEKIRDYLLKPLEADDKSEYFALAGYSREDYWELLRDIRSQLLPGEGEYQRTDEYGDFYELHGHLTGPNGKRLGVRSIWLHEKSSKIRFATLFSDKR